MSESKGCARHLKFFFFFLVFQENVVEKKKQAEKVKSFFFIFREIYFTFSSTKVLVASSLFFIGWQALQVLDSASDGFWDWWRGWEEIADWAVSVFVSGVRERVNFAVVSLKVQ
jgi:hypothetical protein